MQTIQAVTTTYLVYFYLTGLPLISQHTFV